MPNFNLTGKTILVTGATSEIGRAVCSAVLAAGARVVVTGRDRERLAALSTDLGTERCQAFRVDLTKGEERDALVKVAPALDGIVHGAGALELAPAAFLSEEKLRSQQSVNYEAPVLLTTALLKGRKLNPEASVVFMASVAGLVGAKGHVLYAGSKGALMAAGRALALELAPRRIRVNSLAPGMVRSGMADQAQGALGDAAMEAHEKEYPLGFGTPDDVAAAALFLLSPAARWITGTTLVCDGGFTAK